MQETPRSYITIPPSNDPLVAIVWAALRADVPDETGREPPEEIETPPVVAALDVIVANDCAMVQEALIEADFFELEAFENVVVVFLEEEAETVLLVELNAAASTARPRSQS